MRTSTIAKIIIFSLFAVLWCGYGYHSCPHIEQDEIYIVEGTVADTFITNEGRRSTGWLHIVLSDGDTYYCGARSNFTERYGSLKGKEISFIASDTCWNFFKSSEKTALISYEGEIPIEEALAQINSKHRGYMITMVALTLFFSIFVFFREIMEIWDICARKIEEKNAQKRREAKHRKKELRREKLEKQNGTPTENTIKKK